MPTRIEQLRQAGFSDAEIGDWATAERQRMREAGFTDGEIDDEFGVTRPPNEVPAAFIERLKQGNWFHRILGAAGEYAQRYFGDEPLGFSPANREALGKLGVVGDIVVPAAKPVDAILRSIPAGIAGAGAGIGQMVEEGQQAALGPGPYAKGKAARDFAALAQIAALFSGANGPKTPGMRTSAPGIAGSIVALPRAEDFRNAAASIAGTSASFQAEQKLLRLWTEHGIPPIEVAQDAQYDPTIAESIRSESEKLPQAYLRHGETMPSGTQRGTPAQLPEASHADSAPPPADGEAALIKAEDGLAASPNASEPKHMATEGKAISLFDPPQKPQRPFEWDYIGRPRTDPQGQLLHDIEGRHLGAKFVSGRRFYGGPDEPMSPEDIKNAMEQLDIRLAEVSPKSLPEKVLGYYSPAETRHRPVGDIFVSNEISQSDRNLVTAHEFGHAIDHFAGVLSKQLTPADASELRIVYGTLRSGDEEKPYTRQPEVFGYLSPDVPAELAAEGIRAYLTDPNYFKTVAPTAAAKIRAIVNKSPHLKKVIQFNSLGALGLAGAGVRNQGGNDQ